MPRKHPFQIISPVLAIEIRYLIFTGHHSDIFVCVHYQDQFVELGGVRTMCALLHSKENRVVNEAVTALSYIVSDSEENREVVIAENG